MEHATNAFSEITPDYKKGINEIVRRATEEFPADEFPRDGAERIAACRARELDKYLKYKNNWIGRPWWYTRKKIRQCDLAAFPTYGQIVRQNLRMSFEATKKNFRVIKHKTMRILKKAMYVGGQLS